MEGKCKASLAFRGKVFAFFPAETARGLGYYSIGQHFRHDFGWATLAALAPRRSPTAVANGRPRLAPIGPIGRLSGAYLVANGRLSGSYRVANGCVANGRPFTGVGAGGIPARGIAAGGIAGGGRLLFDRSFVF